MKGVAFPLRRGENGFWQFSEDRKLLLDDIASLLYTIPGEVPMHPNLGNLLYFLLFEQGSHFLEEKAVDLARETLMRNEDRVDIIDLTARMYEDNRLQVSYKLKMRETGEIIEGENIYELYW